MHGHILSDAADHTELGVRARDLDDAELEIFNPESARSHALLAIGRGSSYDGHLDAGIVPLISRGCK